MRDIQGIKRGKCNVLHCECEEYRTVSSDGPSGGGKLRCEYCNHTPAEHVKIIDLGACSKCGDCEKYESEELFSYTDCSYCGCGANYHAGAEKLRKPQPQPQPVVQPGIGAALSPGAVLSPTAGGIQPRLDTYGQPMQSSQLGCKAPGCLYGRRIEGNKIHDFCSKTCAQRFAQMQPTSSSLVTDPGMGMGHGTTGGSSISPQTIQAMLSMISGGGAGGGGVAGVATGGGGGGTAGGSVGGPAPINPSASGVSVTTIVMCSKCGKNPANNGHKWCQSCFQTIS